MSVPSRAVRFLIPSLVVALLLAVTGASACGGENDAAGPGAERAEVGQRVQVPIEEAEATRAPEGEEVLEELPQLRRGERDTALPAIRGSEGLTVPEWLERVSIDVGTFWRETFEAGDVRYEPPFHSIFTRATRTDCDGGVRVPRTEGPFYCGLDRTMFLPVQWFNDRAQEFGDAGAAIVVAHEHGHHVQRLIGVIERRDLLQIQKELQADCLAGAWAQSVLERGLLEPDDIGEILSLLHDLRDAPGTPFDDPEAHGDTDLRQGAFFHGYNEGVGGCRVRGIPQA